MMPVNQRITALAHRAPGALAVAWTGMTILGKRWPDRAVQTMTRLLPPADAAVLKRPAVRDAFARGFLHASTTTGRAGAQDYRLFARGWGFRLEDIAVPVHVWQGDIDRNVPLGHGRRQADSIPGAVFHLCPGEGHLLYVDHMSDILGELTSRRTGPPIVTPP